MAHRCASIQFLKECASTRKWTGKCSTTQCISGTRCEYLKIKTDYAEKPEEQAFRIIGSRGDDKLNTRDHDRAFVQEKLEYENITGIFDILEMEGDEVRLIDTKVSGSYKIAKAIGVVKDEDFIPVCGPDGVQEVYKSGQKKGQGKTKKVSSYSIDPNQKDILDWELQLNFYRILIERNGILTGLDLQVDGVTHMYIQGFVRDGGTYIAEGRGVKGKMYMIPVDHMDDEKVIAYFLEKRDALLQALETGDLPHACNNHEAWGGMKCKKYCPVAEKCKELDPECSWFSE
jgi:hypothetical protein